MNESQMPGTTPPPIIATDAPTEGVCAVRVSGEVDMASADLVAHALHEPQCRESAVVLLDLTDVSFMDSSGLRVVLVMVEERPGDFGVLAGPDSQFVRLLDIAELRDRVPLFEDQAAAIHALSGGSRGE